MFFSWFDFGEALTAFERKWGELTDTSAAPVRPKRPKERYRYCEFQGAVAWWLVADLENARPGSVVRYYGGLRYAHLNSGSK